MEIKLQEHIRYVPDIGMFAIDRSRRTCKHATSFCRSHCYNAKLEKCYTAMAGRDIRNDIAWGMLDGHSVSNILDRKRLDTSRVRLCTRGEPFSTLEDVERVKSIISGNPDTTWWIPTRAWHDVPLRDAIELDIMPLSNARVMASTDPSDDRHSIYWIKARGWSTMFFGDDSREYGYKCPKTWDHVKGACMTCEDGCFSGKRVDVHLKQH